MKQEVRFREPVRRGGIGRTVSAFALGATVGSIVALLCAPASGKVTRKRIAMRMRALRQQTVKQLGKTQRILARRAEGLREATTQRLHHAREWVAEHITNGNGKRALRQRTVRHA